MPKTYHILNGDCLKDMFPQNIEGEIIVTRECLVDGDVSGDSLDDLLETRSKFICAQYPGFSKEEYHAGTSVEIKKMLQINAEDEVNLWFEDDLFCQVNLWFCLNLLAENTKYSNVFLVRPNKGNEYNFGRMSQNELSIAFQDKLLIDPDSIKKLSNLWKFYQAEDWEVLQSLAIELNLKFPFLLPAVNAQIDRLSKGEKEGRPKESLKEIIKDLNTTEFGPVFQEFCKREEIYGFGDFQVKNLLNEILGES